MCEIDANFGIGLQKLNLIKNINLRVVPGFLQLTKTLKLEMLVEKINKKYCLTGLNLLKTIKHTEEQFMDFV